MVMVECTNGKTYRVPSYTLEEIDNLINRIGYAPLRTLMVQNHITIAVGNIVAFWEDNK